MTFLIKRKIKSLNTGMALILALFCFSAYAATDEPIATLRGKAPLLDQSKPKRMPKIVNTSCRGRLIKKRICALISNNGNAQGLVSTISPF